MDRINFKLDRASLMGSVSRAYVDDPSDPSEVVQAAYDTISTDLWIEIGGVKMHAAAWSNPDHWADDWRKLAGDEAMGDENEGLHDFIAEAMQRAKEAA